MKPLNSTLTLLKPKSLKTVLATALVTILVYALPAHAGLFDKAPNPVVLEAQGKRGEEFKQMVGDDSALDKVAKFTSPAGSKVAISTVRMTFSTQSSAASTENRPGGRTDSQYVDYSLSDVKPEDVQKIADLFYGELVKALTAKGYAVQAQDYLMSEAKFTEALAQTKSPAESEALIKKSKAVTAFAQKTASFSGIGHGGIDANAVSRAKSDAIVLELEFDVDMVTIKKASDKGNWFQANQIAHKPALHVKSGWVRFHLNGDGREFIFAEKVMLPGEVFAKVDKKANSATDTAASIVGALIGAGGHTNSYSITPVENFPEAIAKSLQPFAEVVINALPH